MGQVGLEAYFVNLEGSPGRELQLLEAAQVRVLADGNDHGVSLEDILAALPELWVESPVLFIVNGKAFNSFKAANLPVFCEDTFRPAVGMEDNTFLLGLHDLPFMGRHPVL